MKVLPKGNDSMKHKISLHLATLTNKIVFIAFSLPSKGLIEPYNYNKSSYTMLAD